MTSPRLPPLRREDCTNPDQRAAVESLEKETTPTFGSPTESAFTYTNDAGALIGPFPFFLAAPDAGTHLLGIFRKLGAIPGLPPDAKETVILTVGAHFQAPYELYAHSNVAIKRVGMPEYVVNAVARGEKPEALNEKCSLAYDAATYLVSKPGKLSDALWEKCIAAFGKEGTVALVHYVYVMPAHRV